MSIKAENLTYTYMKGTPFEATAIEDVSFEVPDGNVLGIVGN